MLCLDRKHSQTIEVQTPIGTLEIKVLELNRRAVKLGFAGPQAFRVLRGEIATVPSVTPLTSAALVAEYGEREGTP